MNELALALLRLFAERGAETGFVRTPTGAVRYARFGSDRAPQLLLLHGLGDSLAGWVRVLPALARSFRVHAIDLPGHGLSAAPPDWRLATLLAAVRAYAERLDRPLLVGHSLGGWLAARLALELRAGAAAPRALVLVNPGGALLAPGEWAPFRALLDATDARGARAYLARAFHRPPLALRLYPQPVLAAMADPAARGILAAISAPDFLAPAELRSLTLPVRLVWGEADRLLPAATLPFFREHLQRAEFVPIPGAGHLPQLEAQRALADAIARPFPPR